MVQFERPKVTHPLVSFIFGVHYGVYLHAGKGKCCMWSVKKVEIHLAKIGCVDCKWSSLNAPRSYTPWSHSLLGYIVRCPFHSMQEMGNAACGLLKKWKSIVQK